jgi:hypothetical protein
LGIAFGTLWGVALALWILAPILVEDHRIWPRTPAEWLTLLATLTAMCTAIAAVMSLFTTPMTIQWAAGRRREYRRPDWVAALAPAAVMPLAYLAVSVVVERSFARGTFVGLDSGNWATLRPLLDQGRLPTFARLGLRKAVRPERVADAELAALLAALPANANVMIVADHGHTATTENPLWLGWHGTDATFIAAGPAFAPRADHVGVSYFDVGPTILDVLGFAAPEGLHGTSIRAR